MLATLGEVDAAGEALRKIREDTGPAFVPRAWARHGGGAWRAPTRSAASDLLDTPQRARGAAAGGPGGLRPGRRQGAGRGPDASWGPRPVEFDPGSEAVRRPGRRGQAQRRDAQANCRPSAREGRQLAGVLRPRAARPGHGQQAQGRRAPGQGAAGPRRQPARRPTCCCTIDRKQRPSAVDSEAKVARLVRGRNGGCSYLAKSK